MQALKQERARRVLEGAPASIVMESEEAIVGFFIEGCRFEMQSGHTERAVASIQAALEYACFAPSFPVGMLCLCVTCCAMQCCALPCWAMPCCAMACCAVLCCAVLCCAVLCCAVHVLLLYAAFGGLKLSVSRSNGLHYA